MAFRVLRALKYPLASTWMVEKSEWSPFIVLWHTSYICMDVLNIIKEKEPWGVQTEQLEAMAKKLPRVSAANLWSWEGMEKCCRNSDLVESRPRKWCWDEPKGLIVFVTNSIRTFGEPGICKRRLGFPCSVRWRGFSGGWNWSWMRRCSISLDWWKWGEIWGLVIKGYEIWKVVNLLAYWVVTAIGSQCAAFMGPPSSDLFVGVVVYLNQFQGK